jgi:hypothetical protein
MGYAQYQLGQEELPQRACGFWARQRLLGAH